MGDGLAPARVHSAERPPVAGRISLLQLLERRKVMDWLSQHARPVVGVYVSALGLGSWLSRYVQRGLARRFVEVELAVALLGGASAPLLFLSFGYLPQFFRVVLYAVVLVVGTLVGLEIPLVLRILRESVDFKELVAKVLTFDYLGALAASLLFPILLVPHLGLVRTSLLFGLASAAVGLWSTWLFRPLL